MAGEKSVSVPYGIEVVNPAPLEVRYGPWPDLATALANIPPGKRYTNLVIAIGVIEYVWRNGTTDAHLVVKDTLTIVELGGSTETLSAAAGHHINKAIIITQNLAGMPVDLRITAGNDFPVGSKIPILQKGDSQIVINPNGNITITAETLKTRKKGSWIEIVKVSATEYAITGDLELL